MTQDLTVADLAILFFIDWELAAADFFWNKLAPAHLFWKKIAAANLFKKKIAAADKFEILRPRKQELVGRVFQACSESAVNTCEIRKKNWGLAPVNNPSDKNRR